MSIADLIQAAEYIERRDRESEHGYASSLPAYEESRAGGRRPKTKKSQGSRTTHNELEKNRCLSCFEDGRACGLSTMTLAEPRAKGMNADRNDTDDSSF